MGSQDDFEYALKSNESWANYKSHQNPGLFEKLANGQSPKILWIGCSDSRVPETTILGLHPGDVFVHRNVANIISPTDINSQAVIEYAVVHLKVSHIVVCGHSACGGCGAALSDARVGGVIDAWITPLKALRKQNEEELKAIRDEKKRAVRLAEMNVKSGVESLLSTYFIEEAVRERGLKVHGCVYDVACGRMTDLKCGNAGKKGVAGVKEDETEIVKGNHGMLVFGGDGASMTIR
ncbi:carbonic anhydrase [Hyaloscypha bicolor E]|uniref:Carbonic anhydrase n=1 Tax=Hyaloscypha bicolor E TaxID=1095630 RepID=A0A2J6T855_9HELO|nr:carbonic anhydrase [Hyaloscypha bicolor E]PMD59194.1 carbonic anhydrase [Hyaloscypha bicolor E]